MNSQSMAFPKSTRSCSIPLSLNDTDQAPVCNICSEKYDDSDADLIPRNLSCGHSMCSKCIFRCMHLDGRPTEKGFLLTCPSKCAEVTIIPEGLIQNLPKNFAVLDIIQDVRCSNRSPSISINLCASSTNMSLNSIEEYKCDVCETRRVTIVCPSCAVCLCEVCSHDIHSRKGYDLHKLVPMDEFMSSNENIISNGIFSQQTNSDSDVSGEAACSHHANELLEFECETCCEEICKICRLSEEHKYHETRLLQDIALEKKEGLRQAINKIEDCHSAWNNGFDECQEVLEHLFNNSRTVETTIKTHFHAIHSILHTKEANLLSQIQKEVEYREKSLKKQADHLAKVCSVAKDLINECEKLLHYGTTSEVVKKADKIIAQAQQYAHSEQDTTPVVTCCMEIDFSSEEELIQRVDTLGELLLAPKRVENLKVASTTSSTSEVTITWMPSMVSSTNNSPITYTVEHSSKGNSGFKSIYKGKACEYVLEDCQINEDTVHMFRVAAVNEIGKGPYSMPVKLTKTKASFLWDPNLKHPKARISNSGYSVSIGENATWVSVGTNTIFSHGRHFWEVVLDRYGTTSLSRKVVVGVVSSDYHQWHRSHGVIGIKTCPIGHHSWGLACGTAKKLCSGSTFLNSLGRKHNLFKEGDSVGVLLDLNEHTLAFYRNGEPLAIQFNDVYGPVIPAISFCRNKTMTLRFPPPPPP